MLTKKKNNSNIPGIDKHEINLLFLQDVDISLMKSRPCYYAKKVILENSDIDNLWTITNAPLICRGHLKDINDSVCFDYDELSPEFQKRFQLKVMHLTKTDDYNSLGQIIYKQETKIYKKNHK